MKKIIIFPITAILLSLTVLIGGCASSNAENSSALTETTGTSTTVNTEIAGNYTDEDLDNSWDEATATKISLNGSSIEVGGSGASANGSVLTISSAGTYVLSGTLSDGQILVSSSGSGTVKLVLNGADITCTTGAPIYASDADKLIITLAEGTQNTLTDGGDSFAYADTASEEPDAAVFCKDDLTINGTGTLTVNAGFNNGIGTKDDLLIVSGVFVINAKNHGIRGRDSLTVLDGDFVITAGVDSLQSNNDEDTSKGWISLSGGVYNITSGNDGIQAETALSISGGEYTISAGNSISASDTSDSYKGLKATGDISISGGVFDIDSADDGVHSNGNIAVSGGTFAISSGDDGFHADGDLSISGGDIDIRESYEGLEGATVNITGGIVAVNSDDDAINAAGGNDSGMGGMFGTDSFRSSGEYYINISGGEISFTAGGDGLDSNGDLTISGGNIIGFINSTFDNGAVDCDQGTFTITGGTLIYGGTGVGSVPGGDSTQSYVYLDTGVTAGTEVSVQKDGETLISFTTPTDCQYLALSSPDIVSGESYDVYASGSLAATVTAGIGGGMMMGGGPGNMGGGRDMGGGRTAGGQDGAAPSDMEGFAPGGGTAPGGSEGAEPTGMEDGGPGGGARPGN